MSLKVPTSEDLRHDTWRATLPTGKTVRYTYDEMTETLASITARVDGNEVIHIHDNVPAPMSHAQVEATFADEIAIS